MADLGGPIDRGASDEKFDRYVAALRDHGVSRRAIETSEGIFLGYCGVMSRMSAEHPLGPHHEIGWRFNREAWGKGYATESAGAALNHARSVIGSKTIYSYTAADNLRSQAVMNRLGFERDSTLDFVQLLDGKREWRGLVWRVPDTTD